MDDVLNHTATAREPDDHFFVEPPIDIGDLLSASTTVNPSRRRATLEDWEGRLVAAVVVTLPVVFLGGVISVRATGRMSPWVLVVAGFWFVGAVWYASRAAVRCTFVGTRGVARAQRRLGFLVQRSSFLFADAADLRVTFTRGFKRGYCGTRYEYEWLDQRGRVVFVIRGNFAEYYIDRDEIDHATIAELPVDHDLHFARAAVLTWRVFRGDQRMQVE
jgi:hypothetical protein